MVKSQGKKPVLQNKQHQRDKDMVDIQDKHQMSTINNQENQFEINNANEEENHLEEIQDKSKYFAIESVFSREVKVSDEEYAEGLLVIVEQLLHALTKEKVIDNTYGYDKPLINRNYEDYEEWATEPKVVKRKKTSESRNDYACKISLKVHGLHMN